MLIPRVYGRVGQRRKVNRYSHTYPACVRARGLAPVTESQTKTRASPFGPRVYGRVEPWTRTVLQRVVWSACVRARGNAERQRKWHWSLVRVCTGAWRSC